MANITFDVIDLACQAADNSFFPPQVSMITRSTTQIATVLGYPEYIPSSPPKRYKTLSWSGYSTHGFWVNGVGTGTQLCGARYDYSGSGTIDLSGNQTSKYQKLYSALCTSQNVTYPAFINGGATMIGWCNPDDGDVGIGCPVCDGQMHAGGDFAANTINDSSDLAHFTGSVPSSSFSVVDSTHAVGTGTGQLAVEIGNPLISVLDPPAGRGFGDTIAICNWDNNYSATLSDEYTDAEALANALVINSNGATAENHPRTTGFVSRFTNVSYALNCTNLIVGQSYLVTVDLWTQPSNAHVPKQYGFVATAITQVINDTIAVPAAGSTTTVRNPLIALIS